MSYNLKQLEKIWKIHKDLDNILESFQFSHRDIKSALTEIYNFLVEEINITAFFVETKNEKLINTLYTFGNCNDDIKLRAPLLDRVDHIVCFSLLNSIWYAQPIDVDSHIIGTIAIGFKKEDIVFDTDYYSELLNTVSELLDTFLYGIHSSSMKHSLIMGLQDALSEVDINVSLERASQLLYRILSYEHLLIVYSDQDSLSNSNTIKYYYFDNRSKTNDSENNLLPQLESLIDSQVNFCCIEPEKLRQALGLESINITYLNKGGLIEDTLGFICIDTSKINGLSLLAQELLQIFSEELRQRLIDLNREKNILRKYFPNLVISRLITTKNYEKRYLQPREADIGIIFADLSGFTKMSELILKSPEQITFFVNKWAKGVVTRVFPLGATLDKIIGDCVMLLFGPPFYENTKEEIVKNMLQAAQQILIFTKSYIDSSVNGKIKEHPNYEEFGVSIGCNFCHCTVGLIGPNHDLTAFSSGVNITARLQGVAKTNEILVTERVKEIAENSFDTWKFSEKKSTKVKNISEPLGYYSLILNK